MEHFYSCVYLSSHQQESRMEYFHGCYNHIHSPVSYFFHVTVHFGNYVMLAHKSPLF